MFGNKEEKAAQKAAALADFERLNGLPAPDLAAEILPAFGPDGPAASRGTPGLQIIQVLTWLVRSEPRGMDYMSKLQQPAREGIQLLINAGLIVNAGPGKTKSAYWCATGLGDKVIAEGSAAQYLLQPVK